MSFCTLSLPAGQLNRVKNSRFGVRMSSMKTLETLYIETIEKLRNDIRPRVMLTPEIKAEIKSVWEEALKKSGQEERLKQVFCLLDNAAMSTGEFNELFFRTLKEIKNPDLLIYALAASRKHVVENALKTGEMISFEYFEGLKILLTHKNPEIKEWTLRTIETLGPMSLRLKQEVLRARPSLLSLLNKHQKASAQIIDYLENEWKRIKL